MQVTTINRKHFHLSLYTSLISLVALLFSVTTYAQETAWRPKLASLDVADACAALRGLSIPSSSIGLNTTGATIASTELVSANARDNQNGEFCKVIGNIHPITYNAPDIEFEVNLPSNWNGKSLQFGGGGFNGRLISGLGRYAKQPSTEATPLARGYVTLGSDSGHKVRNPGFDGSFLLYEEALRNYGHEQIKKTHDVAMHLIQARYGTASQYNYFIGGSQGGHEAFDAVQRYPDDYHGAVAGYPAHNVVMLHLSANNYARALLANGGDSWISPEEAQNFAAAIYAVCDDLDRAEDGIISNVSACLEATQDFRVANSDNPVRCDGGTNTGATCLSDAQIEALNEFDQAYDLGFSVFADDESTSVFPKWTPFEGSTFFDGGNPNLGRTGPDNALQHGPGDATPRFAIAQDLTIDTMNDFDPAQYAGRIGVLVEQISANSVNLDRYRENGGKLIYFHGRVDDFIPVYSSIQYWERLQGRYEQDNLSEFVKFYTIPGMGHVTGPFNARIASLDALEAWVERGQAPSALVAIDENDATEGRTRPVCHYPSWPRYNGRGDINSASSFSCAE